LESSARTHISSTPFLSCICKDSVMIGVYYHKIPCYARYRREAASVAL
jgi:hypothetical protein